MTAMHLSLLGHACIVLLTQMECIQKSRVESKVESKVEDPRHALSTLDTRLLYTLTQMYNLAAHPSSALNMGSKFTDIITTYITESWKLRNKLLNLIS